MKANARKLPDVPQLNHLNVVKKGQGVDNLFSGISQTQNASQNEEVQVVFLSIDQIEISSQPRFYFDPEKQQALERSIAKQGILSPLIVRPIEKDNRWELVAGERRLRAAKSLNFTQVPVYIKQLDQQQAKEIALIENLQREDLNALEETEGILGLLIIRLKLSKEEVISWLYRAKNELDGKVTQNVLRSPLRLEVETAFQELGRMSWDSFVSSRLPLLNLPEDLLLVLRQGKLAYTKAKLIAKIKPPELRQQLIEETIEKRLSLSQLKERIKELPLDFEKKKESVSGMSKTSVHQQFRQMSKKVVDSEVWKDSQKWEQIQVFLQKIEEIIG